MSVPAQHITLPLVSSAQVWSVPDATADASGSAITGLAADVPGPWCPSSPCTLLPQQLTAPVTMSEQVCAEPALRLGAWADLAPIAGAIARGAAPLPGVEVVTAVTTIAAATVSTRPSWRHARIRPFMRLPPVAQPHNQAGTYTRRKDVVTKGVEREASSG